MRNKVQVSVSPGEVVDRLTILELKKVNGGNKELEKERAQFEVGLQLCFNRNFKSDSPQHEQLTKLRHQLLCLNEKLWKIEDLIRSMLVTEGKPESYAAYLELALQVPMLNDERSSLKKQINRIFGDDGTEQKIYSRDS